MHKSSNGGYKRNETMGSLNREIEVEALYQFCEEEVQRTAGQGFWLILALVGKLYPRLNSEKSKENEQGRNEISDFIENILVPLERSTSDQQISERTVEHMSMLFIRRITQLST